MHVHEEQSPQRVAVRKEELRRRGSHALKDVRAQHSETLLWAFGPAGYNHQPNDHAHITTHYTTHTTHTTHNAWRTVYTRAVWFSLVL
jgi:hypothetical protein